MTMNEIEALDETAVKAMAEETVGIKGHTIYLVDLDGGFGYSALVFADGRHIYHASDYSLHHRSKSKEELREWYLETMPAKLFTETELRETSEDFAELEAKRYYLFNYYPLRRWGQSIWGREEDVPEWYWREKAAGTAVFSRIGMRWYRQEDKAFVEHLAELWHALKAANNPLRDYEHAKAAFRHEMFNHEYPINWQGDWDVINCFVRVAYKGDGTELDATGWPDEIKRAYVDAAHEVRREFQY